MPLEIPVRLTERVSLFPESSNGTCRTTLVLKDGRRIFDVTIAWGIEIVQLNGVPVGEEKQLGFRLDDIVDVVPWH